MDKLAEQFIIDEVNSMLRKENRSLENKIQYLENRVKQLERSKENNFPVYTYAPNHNIGAINYNGSNWYSSVEHY